MGLNKHQIVGKWVEFKGEIRKAWGRLTDDELESTKGDVTAIRGLVEQRYGKEVDDWESRLNGLFERFKENRDRVVDSVKENIKKH